MDIPTVLIIDDLTENGLKLVKAVKQKFGKDFFMWIHFSDQYSGKDGSKENIVGDLDVINLLKCGDNYFRFSDKEKFLTTVKNIDKDTKNLIVLYDLQLGIYDYLEFSRKFGEIAERRKIDLEKTFFVLIYSSNISDKSEHRYLIDKNGEMVGLATDQFGRQENLETANTLLEEAYKGWRKVFLNKTSLPFCDFMDNMEKLSHKEIDQNGKANELLMRFLRMNKKEFLKEFAKKHVHAIEGDILRVEIKDALKTISGLAIKNENDNKIIGYDERCLCWNGAWLLALGKFRELFPNDDWKMIFNIRQLSLPPGQKFCAIHPKQKARTRRNTINLFYDMCGFLFPNKYNEEIPNLSLVELSQKKMSFLLNFDFTGQLDNSEKTLAERIIDEAMHARGDKKKVEAHDTSQAIWKFWVSCSFSDRYEDDEGIFGNQPRMNIFDRNGKTEVCFGEC